MKSNSIRIIYKHDGMPQNTALIAAWLQRIGGKQQPQTYPTYTTYIVPIGTNMKDCPVYMERAPRRICRKRAVLPQGDEA